MKLKLKTTLIKPFLFFLLLFALLGLFSAARPAWAAEVEDGSGTEGEYTNLMPETGSSRIGWSAPPDNSYLSQTSNRSTAQAIYRVSNTSHVNVSLYSRYGSFATQDGSGEFLRGYAGSWSGERSLQYSAKTGEVYLDGMRMVYDAGAGIFLFLPDENVPGGLVDYGLNVYWSKDGTTYEKADCYLVGVSAEDDGNGIDAHYFEEYEAVIETGAKYLKLVLYDQSSIEVSGRSERYSFAQTGGLAIASVVVDGEKGTGSAGGGSAKAGEETTTTAANDLLEEQFLEETIVETLPEGTPLTPAFREEAAEEGEVQMTAEEEKDGDTKSPSSTSKKVTDKSGNNEVLMGVGRLEEAGEDVIRPASYQAVSESFLDRLCTPEGVAVLFFSLAALLLAVKIFVGGEKRS